jgi:PDZ domain-containing protein
MKGNNKIKSERCLQYGLLSFAIILVILLLTPSGYYVNIPGEITPTTTAISFELNEKETEFVSKGEFYMTSVKYNSNIFGYYFFGFNQIESGMLSYFLSYFYPNSVRSPLEDYVAKDSDSKQMNAYLKDSTKEGDIFVMSSVLNYLNKSFELNGEGIVIGAFTEKSFLKKHFNQGDIIIGIDNYTIETTDDLIKLIPLQINSTFNFTYIVFETGLVESKKILIEDKLDIFAYTKNISLIHNESFNVRVDSASGTSGGFMIALDLVSMILEEDMINGEKIAGSGSIDINGNILKIGNIHLKIITAQKEGADIFLISKENYKEINSNEYDIKIIQVNNLNDAISKLRELN